MASQLSHLAQVELAGAEIGHRFEVEELVGTRLPQVWQITLCELLQARLQRLGRQLVEHDQALSDLDRASLRGGRIGRDAASTGLADHTVRAAPSTPATARAPACGARSGALLSSHPALRPRRTSARSRRPTRAASPRS